MCREHAAQTAASVRVKKFDVLPSPMDDNDDGMECERVAAAAGVAHALAAPPMRMAAAADNVLIALRVYRRLSLSRTRAARSAKPATQRQRRHVVYVRNPRFSGSGSGLSCTRIRRARDGRTRESVSAIHLLVGVHSRDAAHACTESES